MNVFNVYKLVFLILGNISLGKDGNVILLKFRNL